MALYFRTINIFGSVRNSTFCVTDCVTGNFVEKNQTLNIFMQNRIMLGSKILFKTLGFSIGFNARSKCY